MSYEYKYAMGANGKGLKARQGENERAIRENWPFPPPPLNNIETRSGDVEADNADN